MSPLDYAKRICYSSEQTLMFSYEIAKKYQDTKGDYVECGVAAGAQIIAMATGAPTKQIFAFDSFKGIPLPSNRDNQMPGIMMLSKAEQQMLPDPGKQKLETTGATAVSLDDFNNHIKNSGVKDSFRIHPVIGWFEETTKEFVGQIAILRLDGDLYNSTYVCLKNLFPLVTELGCVIIDDWTLPGCRDACNEYFESIGYEPDWHFISDIAYFFK